MDWIAPVAFLRSTAPFDVLPAPLFALAAESLEIGVFPSGTRLAQVGGTPLGHLWIVRRGLVRLEREGQAIQTVEEGEVFGYTSLLGGLATLDVVVADELLAYRIPGDVFRALTGDAAFAAHFAAGLGARLQASLRQAPPIAFPPDLSIAVGSLIRRPAVWVDASSTVGEAAEVMRRERISSVLVRSEPPGIVTDRDFRNRVLADGLGPATPVSAVLSRPLLGIEGTAPVYEAWARLLDSGVHHLAVTREGDVQAVLTDSDLLRTAQGPMAVLRHVERIATRETLGEYPARLVAMAGSLLAGGLDARIVSDFVARLDDSLTSRILHWAEADLGGPPVPYAWIAFGSEGRREQTLVTHQDNGLVHDEAGPDDRRWFQAFAERVNADLATAGFPEGEGGHVARRLIGSRTDWERHFAGALDVPRLYDAGLYADFRRIGGALDVSALDEILARARSMPLFLRFLAREALQFEPPGAAALGLRGTGSSVDLARQGLFPVVFLARCHALEIGAPERGTLARLAAVRDAGLLGDEAHATVPGAFQFLHGLRLRHELSLLRRGEPASGVVPLAALSAIERTRLKDAFRAVRAWQETAAYHYQTRFL